MDEKHGCICIFLIITGMLLILAGGFNLYFGEDRRHAIYLLSVGVTSFVLGIRSFTNAM